MAKMGVLIFLSLLLMAVTIKAGLVRDTENNLVTKDEQYFIIDKEALNETGKSIGASHAPQTFNHTCPRIAVVPYYEDSSYFQVPVSFSPSNGIYLFIRTGHNISIQYEVGKWPCPEENPPVWTLNYEQIFPKPDVHFGDKSNTEFTTFTIEAEGDGYKFTQYNPVTKRTDVIGVVNEPTLGYKRLVLSTNQKPFIFVLEKAETAFKRSSMIKYMLPFEI